MIATANIDILVDICFVMNEKLSLNYYKNYKYSFGLTNRITEHPAGPLYVAKKNVRMNLTKEIKNFVLGYIHVIDYNGIKPVRF
jgi:hypothetical protein